MKPKLLILTVLISLFAGATHAATWSETKLKAGDARPGDRFGASIGLSGTTAIVGSVCNYSVYDLSDDCYGAAYLFDTTTGKQTAQLIGNPTDKRGIGFAVATSDSTAIVGSGRDNATYLFDTATGKQIAKLETPSTKGEKFGSYVAISGNTAIISAFNAFPVGSSYLFDVTTGAEIARLVPDEDLSALVGPYVAISGDTAIVGYERGTYIEDKTLTGVAYLFDVKTGAQLARLIPDDPINIEYFGISVAIHGNTAVVGSPSNDAVYLFDVKTGTQIAKLTDPNPIENNEFGEPIAIYGDRVVVGNSRNNGGAGIAYVFDAKSGALTDTITPSDGVFGSEFGRFVSIFEDTILISAAGDGDGGRDSGAAYLYTMSPEVSEVPLPAGVWLLGSALGLILLRRRRR